MPVLTYDRVAFPIFGLNELWNGPRWLESLNGDQDSVSSVTLAHGEALVAGPDLIWTAVTSIRPSAGPNNDGWLAWSAAHHLTQLTTPRLSQREGRRYETACSSFIVENLNDRSRWQPARWTLDGQAIVASTLTFADAWAGYAVTPNGSFEVIATQATPRTVQLKQVADTTAYHFDGDGPIEFPETYLASGSAVWGAVDGLRRPNWPRHLDHEALLATSSAPPRSPAAGERR